MEWTGVRGKRVVVTGATNGIGLAAARALAVKGAKLAIVARDEDRARDAVDRIRQAGGTGTEVDVLMADLAVQASVRALAAEVLRRYARLDVLVLNAGALFTSRHVTPDGVEATWAVNHLAPFLLTTLLLERLRASAPARIVVTSSAMHQGKTIPFEDLDARGSYRGWARYGETKLANILFTAGLARRLEGSGVTVNAYHPGFVGSGFGRNNGPLYRVASGLTRPFARSPEKGAETLVWLAESDDVSGETGGYFVDRRRVTPSAAAQDVDTARHLWEVSEEQTRAGAAAAAH
jgi:NAD(P)-dependent dehydrogenase (short-subunit alcohol dehydrogenase family)